jgi:uncharacterized membrane protein YeaQ/YmgE (transglycosylase-associated protein family)
VSIIVWIILGGLAGWIASLIVGTNRQQGCLLDIIVGIIGALIGGFIFDAIDAGPAVTGLNLPSLFVAVIGAVVLLLIVKAVRRNR